MLFRSHYILIARMAKPTIKTKKTTQARLGNVAKAGTKGKKRSSPLKNTAAPISNKQKKSQHSSSNATNLAAATHDKYIDSIVNQDVDVVLAGVPNHSFPSQQELQGDFLDDNEEDDNNNHFGEKYNATVYAGMKNTAADDVHLHLINHVYFRSELTSFSSIKQGLHSNILTQNNSLYHIFFL